MDEPTTTKRVRRPSCTAHAATPPRAYNIITKKTRVAQTVSPSDVPRQCRKALRARLKLRRGKRLKLSSVCRLYSTRPSSDLAIFVKLPHGAMRYLENSTPIDMATDGRDRDAAGATADEEGR